MENDQHQAQDLDSFAKTLVANNLDTEGLTPYIKEDAKHSPHMQTVVRDIEKDAGHNPEIIPVQDHVAALAALGSDRVVVLGPNDRMHNPELASKIVYAKEPLLFDENDFPETTKYKNFK